MQTILVTGATGNVGAELVRLLQQSDVHIRAAVSGTRAPHPPLGERVETVTLDFTAPETYAPALQGVARLFLLRPPQISNTRQFINPFLDAARAAGVEHIVFLSLLGAEKNPIVPHRRIEDYLKTLGVPYTFLRPSFFMQNLSTTHRVDIQTRGEIIVPAGKGKTSFIDVRDIAAVAAKSLTEPGHMNQAYPLTGDEALSYNEVAAIFSEVLGRPIRYSNPSLWYFVRHMRQQGYPLGFLLVTAAIYTTARLGLAGLVTPDTRTLLGRAPLTMRHFVADYRECWS